MGDSSASRHALRVLHLEDDLRDARLCRAQLEQAGFQLQSDVVASAGEFEDALRSARYDLILADYNLPGWSGMDALAVLRSNGAADIPFILVSGMLGDETAVECLKRGATDFVLKDRLGRLPVAVQRALDERAASADRKVAERNRDLLAAIVESSDDAIIAVALDGAILSWNRGAKQIYGYAPEEIQGKSISLLFTPDSASGILDCIEALRRGEGLVRRESTGASKAGKAIHVALTMSPIRNPDGGVGRVSAIIRDITEQKRLEQEFFVAQKMEAIGRLAAGVAHDFNNLLTVITGYSALLLGQLNEHDPMHEELSEVCKAGERAASLTRQLLAFSKKQVLQPRVLDLNRIVGDMDRMLRRLIGEDIDLATHLDPRLGTVKADSGQLEQVIMNLAVNARDAMPHGGKLTIETANVDVEETDTPRHINVPPGSYVSLAMTDSGVGMAPETQVRIFEPFFTTKGRAGTGLGLSTVYGIVQQSGGTILVYSELGLGTTFRIYLPQLQEEPAPAAVSATSSIPRGSETILLVEDEDAVRSLISTILQKQGYNVFLASNGGEALLACERHPGQIHLILTDVVMPTMGGGELAARLKELHPEMKVLFMSGYTDNAIIHQGVLSPHIAFLEKPFSPSALARKVREVLDADKV